MIDFNVFNKVNYAVARVYENEDLLLWDKVQDLDDLKCDFVNLEESGYKCNNRSDDCSISLTYTKSNSKVKIVFHLYLKRRS